MSIPKVDIRNLPVTLQIGKNGITDGLISEIDLQLKKRKFVKIKLLRAFADMVDRKEVAKDLANKTKSLVVQVAGFRIVLYRAN